MLNLNDIKEFYVPNHILYNNNLSALEIKLAIMLFTLLLEQPAVNILNSELQELFKCSKQGLFNAFTKLEKEKLIKRKGTTFRRKITRGELFYGDNVVSLEGNHVG